MAQLEGSRQVDRLLPGRAKVIGGCSARQIAACVSLSTGRSPPNTHMIGRSL
ncbi:MAG: hypothetical protein H7Y32_07785 [Chloroflexales bacterium]|nr:hypothetical protein [Chloroflexales bacterium]